MKNKLIGTFIPSKKLSAEAVKVCEELLEIDGMTLRSLHIQSCCEHHYLDFEHFPKEELARLKLIEKIDITGVKGMGLNLRFYNGDSDVCIFVPGRGYNNGYYNSEIILVIQEKGVEKKFDVSEFQEEYYQ